MITTTTTVTVCFTCRSMSRSYRPIARLVAAIWLLSATLVYAHDHQTAPGQTFNLTNTTEASEASTSERESRGDLTIFIAMQMLQKLDKSPIPIHDLPRSFLEADKRFLACTILPMLPDGSRISCMIQHMVPGLGLYCSRWTLTK